jgi:hypothetical protein
LLLNENKAPCYHQVNEFIYEKGGFIKLEKFFNKEILVLSILSLFATSALGDAKQQAYRMHNRLAGVPPSATALAQMETYIKASNPKAAALVAIDDKGFYNVTLKNWVKRWTNVSDDPRVAFNDYVATVIGIVRDDIPFDQVLYGDHLYKATDGMTGITDYSKADNKHYADLETNFVDLKANLVRVSQSATNGIADSAGVLTTRAAGEAFFSAGTNRRMTRFTFMNFLCRDFEAVHDINVPDYHVRRDVDRAPGGDSRTYRNQCVGCHAGQDGLGGAWAYFDFVNGAVTYTPGTVTAKINKNVAYADGFMTTDDSWINLWASGQNSNLGWPTTTEGKGARALGKMISHSRAFAECMSSRVYELICMRKPKLSSELTEIKRLADVFQSNDNFNMKNLFAETSLNCMGD